MFYGEIGCDHHEERPRPASAFALFDLLFSSTIFTLTKHIFALYIIIIPIVPDKKGYQRTIFFSMKMCVHIRSATEALLRVPHHMFS